MTPHEFVARLAALAPHPREHQLTYEGVLAPASSLRDLVVPRPVVRKEPKDVDVADEDGSKSAGEPSKDKRYIRWADLGIPIRPVLLQLHRSCAIILTEGNFSPLGSTAALWSTLDPPVQLLEDVPHQVGVGGEVLERDGSAPPTISDSSEDSSGSTSNDSPASR